MVYICFLLYFGEEKPSPEETANSYSHPFIYIHTTSIYSKLQHARLLGAVQHGVMKTERAPAADIPVGRGRPDTQGDIPDSTQTLNLPCGKYLGNPLQLRAFTVNKLPLLMTARKSSLDFKGPASYLAK